MTIFFAIGVIIRFVTIVLFLIFLVESHNIFRNFEIINILIFLLLIIAFFVTPHYLLSLLVNHFFNDSIHDFDSKCCAILDVLLLTPVYSVPLYKINELFNDSNYDEYCHPDEYKLFLLIPWLLIPSILWAMMFSLPLSLIVPKASVEYICIKYSFIDTVPIPFLILFAIIGYFIAKKDIYPLVEN